MILWLNNKIQYGKYSTDGVKTLGKIYDLLRSYAKPMPKDYSKRVTDIVDCRINRLFGYETHWVDSSDLEAVYVIKDIQEEVINDFKEAFNRGKEEGKGFIKLLNRGEITLNDFENF